jgi:formylglycine-generating enzyme required for sulfatase activity
MLKPIGFWSYSGSDDEADSGRLSQLRTLVKKELQLKVGREPVNIFQDVSAIPPGSKWERQIRERIDDSSFLIPIITPAFLQSEWCYREIRLFADRQARLGRDDLIFPLHYIDVEIIRPEDCHGDLVELLKTHQWSDFRELRLKNPEGEDVRRKLADLAGAVRDALRRELQAPILEASLGIESDARQPASAQQHSGYRQADAPAQPRPQQSAPFPEIRTRPSQPPDAPRQPEAGPRLENQFIQHFPGGPRLVCVPVGRFLMGSAPSEIERDHDEGPEHMVELSTNLAVGVFAVTFSEWSVAQVERGVDHAPNDQGWGLGDQPVINVSWKDAQRYIEWLRVKTGKRYRLPTEAEWEYVARAGTTTPFWWGGTILPAQANYDGRYPYGSGAEGEYRNRPLPVDSFGPNPWGLYQVHGNVWEWCEDDWVANYAQAAGDGSAHKEPPKPRSFLPRLPMQVVRGGSWRSMPKDLRSARRHHFPQHYRGDSIGFRVVCQL